MLANGDFLDGELESISGPQLTIRSVLFGQRRISREDWTAIILREVRPAACAYEVRARDGSVLRASALEIDKGRLRVTEAGGITVFLRGDELNGVRAMDGDSVPPVPSPAESRNAIHRQ